MKRLKDYYSGEIENIIVDKIVSIIIGVVATLLSNSTVFSKLDKQANSHNWFSLACVFLLFYIITTLWEMRPNRYSIKFDSIKVSYEYYGDKVIVKTKYMIRPLKYKIKKMPTRRYWYSDDFDIGVTNHGYKIRKVSEIKKEHRYEYEISFPKPIYFWQKKEIEIEFRGDNRDRKCENFYECDIISPTSNLVMGINVPSEYSTNKAIAKTFYEHENNSKKKENISFNGYYLWQITKPKMHYSYKFQWEWSKQEKKKIEEMQKCNSK